MPVESEQIISELSARLLTLREKHDSCLLVGIDGRDGAGKTTFADALASVLCTMLLPELVIRISLDDFHHCRAVRYQRGKSSPEGFFRDSYDYGAFRERVLIPFGKGGNRRFSPRSHDLASDRLLDPHEGEKIAPERSIVVIDGMFLHRPELEGVWDYSVLLDVTAEVCAERMLKRDGDAPRLDPSDRYFGGQKLYFDTCDPRSKATLVLW